ncbi:hypothetical protein HGRIS_003940 [Hohenbuehelia grisea]|uniref:Angio-associated migratory cell protein n=1 Tax=Hohenbuehelia grisea TaxID=104357 RepID=A0ABR3JH28_9AGAR
MASTDDHRENEHLEDQDEGEQFIQAEDVEVEVTDEGDIPMEDDDEPAPSASHEGGDGDLQTNAVSVFNTHTNSVFAVGVHPTRPLVVSGGQDDLGYIWDMSDGEVLVKLTGHTDSVTGANFSPDGELVATGGMDGKVRVWRRVKTGARAGKGKEASAAAEGKGKEAETDEDWKHWEFLTELQGPDEVMWVKWHPKGNVLLVGSNDGTAWMWQLPSGTTMQVFAGHSGSVQCGEFTPDGKRVVTACAGGDLIVWDPRSPTPVFKLSEGNSRLSTDGVTSLGINPASTIAVVGGANGAVHLVGLAKGEVIATLSAGHTPGESIEAIAFTNFSGGGSGALLTGASDGIICVWDLTTMRLRSSFKHDDTVTSLIAVPAPKNYLVVSACADGSLRTWDARTGSLVREHNGHQGAVLSFALALDGTTIVSAGDDGVCLVFTTEETDEEGRMAE